MFFTWSLPLKSIVIPPSINELLDLGSCYLGDHGLFPLPILKKGIEGTASGDGSFLWSQT